MDGFRKFVSMTAADLAADCGKGINMIGRWHDIAEGAGVIIAETDCHGALSSWVLKWSEFGECKVTPVLNDQDAKIVLAAKFGGSVQN